MQSSFICCPSSFRYWQLNAISCEHFKNIEIQRYLVVKLLKGMACWKKRMCVTNENSSNISIQLWTVEQAVRFLQFFFNSKVAIRNIRKQMPDKMNQHPNPEYKYKRKRNNNIKKKIFIVGLPLYMRHPLKIALKFDTFVFYWIRSGRWRSSFARGQTALCTRTFNRTVWLVQDLSQRRRNTKFRSAEANVI